MLASNAEIHLALAIAGPVAQRVTPGLSSAAFNAFVVNKSVTINPSVR